MTKKTKKQRGYPAQFKADAVKLAQAGEASVPEIARRLGVSDKSLYDWIRASSTGPGGGAHAIHERNQVLETENRRLRQERDILKKSLGLFAKDVSP